jgi:hypothetical protein
VNPREWRALASPAALDGLRRVISFSVFKRGPVYQSEYFVPSSAVPVALL